MDALTPAPLEQLRSLTLEETVSYWDAKSEKIKEIIEEESRAENPDTGTTEWTGAEPIV